jgi:hypothetical protein
MTEIKTTTSKAAKYLKELANIFEYRDWNYTRQTHIKSIRYEPEHDFRNKLSFRIKSSIGWLISPPTFMRTLEPAWKDRLRSRFLMPLYLLRREPNTPDGILDSGNIITFWEETGEYLNMMQPTVGTLIADFILEDPTNPHAILINKELTRLHKSYQKRVKAGEVE